jgi:hypothetical protein
MILQLVFIQPLFFIYYSFLYSIVCFFMSFEMIFLSLAFKSAYPSRLLMIFVCLVVKFNTKLIERECVNSGNVERVLRLTEKTCKLFGFYVRTFIFLEHIFIVVYLFGIFSVLTSKIINPEAELNLFRFGVQFVLLFVEVLNLMTLVETCKSFKSSVSRIQLKSSILILVSINFSLMDSSFVCLNTRKLKILLTFPPTSPKSLKTFISSRLAISHGQRWQKLNICLKSLEVLNF